MFLLDTNVLSTLMSMKPSPEVRTWMSGHSPELLFTASVCQAEILSGIAILPEGRRRSDLAAAAQAMFAEDFEGRVLPFDPAAATAYAGMFATRRKLGRPAATADLMIGAIARVHGASVVTRNVADFDGGGVPVVNPWAAQPS